jgi:hypothetical protein
MSRSYTSSPRCTSISVLWYFISLLGSTYEQPGDEVTNSTEKSPFEVLAVDQLITVLSGT